MMFRLNVNRTMPEEIVANVHAPSPLTDEIEALVAAHSDKTTLNGYTEDEIFPIKIDTVEYVFVEEGKTYTVTDGGKRYRLKYRLYELEEILPSCFVKINKSALANKNKIARFKVQLTGAVDVVFKSGCTDYVSRRCFAELKKKFDL